MPDEKVYVDTSDAYDHARDLRERYAHEDPHVVDTGQYDPEFVADHLRVEGQFVVGTSSGAGVCTAEHLHEEHGLAEDDTVVIVLCDRGDRYADIPLWDDYLSVEV